MRTLIVVETRPLHSGWERTSHAGGRLHSEERPVLPLRVRRFVPAEVAVRLGVSHEVNDRVVEPGVGGGQSVEHLLEGHGGLVNLARPRTSHE